jgi:glucokinase
LDAVNPWVLSVDIGGTWTRFAALDRAGKLIARTQRPTGSEGSHDDVRAIWKALLADLTGQLSAAWASEPSAVGVGATGPIECESGRIFAPPNTGNGLAGLALVFEFNQLTGAPVAVERDTNAALLAERAVGAGVGFDELVYLTVSTGVGGAAMSRGELLRGRNGGAMEVGHIVVERDGPLCGCGRNGCLEAVASGPSLAVAARQRSGELEANVLRSMLDTDERFTGASVDSAARAGDPVARSIVARAGAAIASAVVDLANAFDPDLIILGGSVAAAHPEWIGHARAALSLLALEPTRYSVRVAPAGLGDDGVLMGAAIRAWQIAPST